MAIKKYNITVWGTGGDAFAFGDDVSQNVDALYGIIIDGRDRWWNIDWNYINDALEENEDFAQALQDEGFDTNFDKYEPAELYEKLTSQSIEDIFSDWCQFENIGEGFYDLHEIFKAEANEVREYLDANKDINTTRISDNEADAYIDRIIEIDESKAYEIKEKLEEIYKKYDSKVVSSDISYRKEDPVFGIKLFAVKWSSSLGASDIDMDEVSE